MRKITSKITLVKSSIVGILVTLVVLGGCLIPSEVYQQISDMTNSISSKFFNAQSETKNTTSSQQSNDISLENNVSSKETEVKSNKVIEQPKPDTPIEQPKKKSPVEQPKEKSPVEQPKKITKPKSTKPNIVAVEPPKINIPIVEPPKQDTVETPPKTYKPATPSITENIVKPNLEFIVSNSIEEAQQFAVNQLNIYNADYTGFDLQMANAFNNRLVYAYNLLPKLTGIIKFVGTDETRENKTVEVLTPYFAPEVIEDIIVKSGLRTQAAASFWYPSIGNSYLAGLDGIAIHKILSADYDFSNEISKLTYDSAPSPKDCFTIESVIDHEIGHAIDRFYSLAENQEIIDYHSSLTVDDITYGLSDYATTSIREFIAESWSEYMNAAEPRPIAKKIGDFIMALNV